MINVFLYPERNIVVATDKDDAYSLIELYRVEGYNSLDNLIISEGLSGLYGATVIDNGVFDIYKFVRPNEPNKKAIVTKEGTVVKRGDRYYLKGAVLRDYGDELRIEKGKISLSSLRPFSLSILRRFFRDLRWLPGGLIVTDGKTEVPRIIRELVDYFSFEVVPAIIAINGRIYVRELAGDLMDFDVKAENGDIEVLRARRVPAIWKVGKLFFENDIFIDNNLFVDLERGEVINYWHSVVSSPTFEVVIV